MGVHGASVPVERADSRTIDAGGKYLRRFVHRGVIGHACGPGSEQADAVEGVVLDLLELTLQLDELLRIVLDVAGVLGHVLGHRPKLEHPE